MWLLLELSLPERAIRKAVAEKVIYN